jgi:putative DNA primase/helicase
VRNRFVQDGNRFYFPDGAPAFKDLGRKLTTGSENTQVVRSLIEIAHSRGWSEVTVSGTERFRPEAWRQARLEGLAVRGYRPTELEQAQLVRALSRTLARPAGREDAVSADRVPAAEPVRGRNPDVAAASSGPRSPAQIAGRLLEHGRDHYRHDPDEDLSYFERLQTAQGTREIWGKDIERAVERSLSQLKIGDEIVLQRSGRTPVTVRRTERSEAGAPIERPLETFRNQWSVEEREFFVARAQTAQVVRDAAIEPKEAVRQRPELAGTYVALHAAALAARSLRNPEDQARFVSRVRETLADGIQSGEPLIAINHCTRSRTRTVINGD